MFFLDYFFIAISVLLIASIRPVKPISKFNEDYLSKDNCNILRGFLVFIPPITHLSNQGVRFNESITMYTSVIVTFFFFFSGYGLAKQHLSSDNYSDKYLLKRLPKVVIPYIVATFAFVVVDFVFLGFLYPISDILHAIAYGQPIVIASWYVIHIIAFYIWFFFMIKIAKKNRILLSLFAILYYILSTIACVRFGWESYWWETSYGLVIGVVWADFEREIIGFCKKYYYFVLCGVLTLTIVYQMYGKYIWIRYSLSVITVIIMMMKINLKNPLLDFFGSISFEMYMIHGAFMVMGRSNILNIENEPLYVLFVMFGTIASAWIMKYVDVFLIRIFNNCCKKVKLL